MSGKVFAKYYPKIYKTQRDNAKGYYLHGSNYVDQNGKVLFAAKDLDKFESKLFDRTTECFISTGSMFCDALHKAEIIPTAIDEQAYKQAVIANAQGKEDRFWWAAHERALDKILPDEWDFRYMDYDGGIVRESIDRGFPVMASIWIKPWYPSGEGHLVLIVGYVVDEDGVWLGWIVNDPFGDCTSKYINHDGKELFYSASDWKKMQNSPTKRKIGVLFKK